MMEEHESATWDESSTQEVNIENHWVECVSDNGETYFTNVVTGETSWTKPELEQDQNIWTGGYTKEFSTHEENAAEAEMLIDSATIADQNTEAVEVIYWLELCDSDQQEVYYFAPHTGVVRWEPPQEATALVRHCNSDAVLNAVVSLQSVARSQQARARVAAMRQQKMKEHQLEDDNASNHLNEHEVSEDVGTDDQLDPDSQNHDAQWVEVYDPATQQQYYYSPRTSETSWDPPDTFVSSTEDRKVAAAISIQSLSRGRLARKQVRELRAQSPKRDNQVIVMEDESEREAMCRREMNHQELLQLAGGDRFWGLDNYEREMMQRRIEEELMARTKALNEQRFSISPQTTSSGNILLDYLDFEEEEMDPERLQREQQQEHDARIAMSREEAQQCQDGDSFWGIQAEETRQRASNLAMAQEESASRRFADDVLKQALSATWEAEVLQNAAKELAARGGHEQRMQERYLQWFYHHCVSVDELLEYRWPTKQQQECLENAPSPTKRRHQVVQLHADVMASATPYPLDDLIVRERLEHGDLRFGLRSILTVHHQNARGTNGTHFEITMASPECAFDEAAAAALLKNQALVYPSGQRSNSDEGSLDEFNDRVGNGSQNREMTSGSSVNYHRSRTPDPHIPARFNGVPYKPNQISPTREILSGDHRKLNQLPSIVKLKPSAEAPKIRQLQKAKVKARAKAKLSNHPAQPSPNNRNGSDSARESETDQVTDAVDEGPRAQFKRQEHEVLFKLFALMDLDESGTVNQDEMRWALQRDAEIHALATTSPLLRLLLKQRTRLEALFSSQVVEESLDSNTEIVSRNESSSELSLDEFLTRCEHSYLHLMSEGLIQPHEIAATEAHAKALSNSKYNYLEKHPKQSARETEAQTIRRVFALLDFDKNGVLDVAEVQQALYNSTAATPKSSSRPDSTGVVSKELRALVEGSKALQPMLHQELFMTAFTKFESMDPRGICEEEFVAFCLEIANVAAANNMVASVG